jgi:NADH dehydrogenase [ubiquinone] 1 alpha subcomplex assembly factor 5
MAKTWCAARTKSSSLKTLWQNARPAQDRDFSGTRFFQDAHAAIGCCAAGMNIVDQKDMSALGHRPALGMRIKCTSHHFASLVSGKSTQWGGSPGPLENVGAMFHSRHARNLPSNKRRLIEATRPQSRPMQWNRREQCIRRRIAHMPHQLLSNHPRQTYTSAIFQPKRDIARYVTVCDRSLYTVMPGRFGKAGRAFLRLFALIGQWQIAAGAGRRAQKDKAAPAFCTKRPAAFGNHTAGWASLWQCKVDYGAKGSGQHLHAPLVQQAASRHKREMADMAPQIFDNRRRMALRARAMRGRIQQSFLLTHMATELSERLSFVSRSFENVLFIGPIADFAADILGDRKMQITAEPMLDEEALPFAPASFDLILSAGTLDSVNDLPGALLQIRRALKPDGLFLGTSFGAGSLPRLKNAMMAADAGQVRAHIHPQIDLRSISDLMTRAGFALPVADVDMLSVRYRDWRRLVGDIRDAGVGNAMAGLRTFQRALPRGLDIAWQSLADDNGKVTETFNFLQLNGWAPSPHQPKPAARGSGSVSLVDVLGKLGT